MIALIEGITGFYWVLPGLSGLYRVLPGFRGPNCVSAAAAYTLLRGCVPHYSMQCGARDVRLLIGRDERERERERGAPGIADDDVGDDDDDVVDRRRGPPNSRSFPTRNLMDAAGHLFYHSLDAINLLKLCRNPAGQSSDLGGNDS